MISCRRNCHIGRRRKQTDAGPQIVGDLLNWQWVERGTAHRLIAQSRFMKPFFGTYRYACRPDQSAIEPCMMTASRPATAAHRRAGYEYASIGGEDGEFFQVISRPSDHPAR